MTIQLNTSALKAEHVGDLLASTASVFGYTPTESLVVIGITDEGVIGSHLRADLENIAKDPCEFGSNMGNMLKLNHGSSFVLALSSTAPEPGEFSTKLEYSGAAFCAGLEAIGVAVQNAWHVGAGYSRPLLTSDAQACPYPGKPVDMNTPTARQLQPSREVTPHDIVQSYTADHHAPTPLPGSAITGLQLWDDVAAATVSVDTLAPTDIGHLATALANHPTAIIVTMTADLLQGISALHCDDDCETHSIITGAGFAPDWHRIDRTAAALKAMTPYADATTSANIHAIMSWISFAKGSGSLALAFAKQAQQLKATNYLANTLQGMVETGKVASWAASSLTAYPRR